MPEAPNAEAEQQSPAQKGGQVVGAQEKGTGNEHDYTDGRVAWDWKSRFPSEAISKMRTEAIVLLAMLGFSLAGSGICLGLAAQPVTFDMGFAKLHISFKLLALFCTGCVGGVTFSIKWLVHAAAKGKWHIDRRFWRLMVPVVGGVYACVVITLFNEGFFAANVEKAETSIASAAALAFLVGYFSDGVSGLLSNVANAVFGTLEKK